MEGAIQQAAQEGRQFMGRDYIRALKTDLLARHEFAQCGIWIGRYFYGGGKCLKVALGEHERVGSFVLDCFPLRFPLSLPEYPLEFFQMLPPQWGWCQIAFLYVCHILLFNNSMLR